MKKSSLIDLNVFRKVLIGLGISSSLFYPNNALADSYLTSKNEVTTTVQQTKKITGNVTNTAGEPIIGATVLEKGNTTNGTITDIDGNFTINLPANATLSISYIGYITQEIQVGYQTSFKVVLKDDTKTLDEIIVVGYGSQKKANLTGAVSSVKMDEALGDRPLLNAADALQGAVPGLFVSNGGNAPGTSKSFQIRGAYSLGVKNSDGTYGNTIKPLVLIDNVEGDIDMINPEDIESINVLKDAASAAIYGARAAGGVILVTTKRPKGASRFELNYNNNFAFGKAVNLPKQAPLMDYLQAYLDCGYSDAYWSLGSPSVSKWMEYLTAYQKDPSSFNTVGDGIYVDESGVPYYLNEKRIYESDDLVESMKKEESKKSRAWNVALYQGDKGMHETIPWYAAGYDDSDWTPTDLFASGWATNGLNTINGSHWFRKDFQVSGQQAGEKATLRLGCIVDADSVYVNGTFVGTVSYQYPPRIYTIPAGLLKVGKNTITIRLFSYGGFPHFVKEKPYKILFGKGQPEKGESEISLEGDWKYRLGAPMPAAPGQTAFHYKPVGLYNAMIAPLLNYTVSGVIWYQGESNVSRRNEYKDLLTAMIADWRQHWNRPDMPFYVIELADFLSPEDKGGRAAWAEFRKVQAEVANTNKNVTLIKNGDLGEWNDIHPLDKKTLGQRVSQAVFQQRVK